MNKKLLVLVLWGLVGLTILVGANFPVSAAPTATVGEGHDFATLEFRNPWDMNAFRDVSQWINHAGASNYVTNLTVEDGVFSGTASGVYSDFYPLFPGYEPGLKQSDTGILTPIASAQYHCFYMAMKVDIPESDIYYWNVSWVEDRSMEWGSGAAGKTYGNQTVNNQWVLYQMDLSTWPYQSGDPWDSLGHWLGFRVTPIMQRPNTTFHVDWVRLTDCAPVHYALSGLPSGTYSLWVGTGSPERQIRVLDAFSPDGSGNYQWDVQGIEPDTYNYYVKDGSGGTVQQGSLTIEPAPIPMFTSPSPFSGQDYATSVGNPWDMQDNGDIIAASCTSYAIVNDILYVDTLPPSSQPPSCVGSGANEADPKIYLNTPVADDISQYRYLSVRHKIDGEWGRPAQGMVIRWIWEMAGLAPAVCKYVSREIALDVDWVTYWVDLHDPWNGTPVEVGGTGSGACPTNVQWKTQQGTLTQFRMDPNENVLNYTFHQEFDWIRLTKVPTVIQGLVFPIQVSMNKAPETIETITFYYTDDLSDPTQHLAQGGAPSQVQQTGGAQKLGPQAANQVFLPFVGKRYSPPITLPSVENEIRFDWKTNAVVPGEYYICAVTADGYNQTTFCSQAPVQVLP